MMIILKRIAVSPVGVGKPAKPTGRDLEIRCSKKSRDVLLHAIMLRRLGFERQAIETFLTAQSYQGSENKLGSTLPLK